MAGTLLLRYVVGAPDPRTHLLEVELHLASSDGPLRPSLTLYLPTWSPGSYLIREYARHLEGLTAEAEGKPLAVRKIRKNAWSMETRGARNLQVRYRLYANEISVRTNHVDTSHASWRGPATYLVPEGYPGETLEALVQPSFASDWSTATALQKTPEGYRAHSLDELMDSPFECGPMEPYTFEVYGRPHHFWIWRNRYGAEQNWEKLIQDTRTIIHTEAALLAGSGRPEEALPYNEYSFLWHVFPRSRGGLEHANCCALLVAPGTFHTRGGYLDVLSLVAHEFLHLWNVKRIRPQGLWKYDYERENYTRLLWWFEGGTSYFDWRVLRLSGLVTHREYADHLAGELARLVDTPGAQVHSLSDASFDAWIKAYRPDENSLNSTVSYYLKGEVVCALLDIELRARSCGARSLDDVLRHLWRAYGAAGRPVPEDGMAAAILEATGVRVDDLLTYWVDSPNPIDVGATLAHVGLRHERRPHHRQGASSLGARVRHRAGRYVLDSLTRGGAAMRAGLEPGDELLSIHGRRVEDNLDSILHLLHPGTTVDVVVSRDGWIETAKVTMDPPLLGEGRLVVCPNATPTQLALLEGWLGPGAAAALRDA
ncbi:MAG: PDZ domain-containing protein [Myxococcales bacterium]|nr:PDZ domain-containing protein [Polyangiaceae bacterium]MDW8249999.1 PDZ domain-containing protein [Myxococcales bacterium]